MQKNILLTGATSGIGEAAAIDLAAQGHRLFLTARSSSKAKKTESLLRAANPSAQVHWLFGDFAKLDDVRKVAEEFIALGEPLDVFFSNAGIATGSRQTSADGYEMMFAVNHLAPFLLTNLLMDKLSEGSGETRVVITASDAHKFVSGLNLDDLQWREKFSPMKAYGHSKLANILFTQSLSKVLPQRAPQKTFSINCFHPGFVATGLATDTRLGKIIMGICRPFIRSGTKGAETGLFLATDPSVRDEKGGYFFNCKQQKLKPYAQDSQAAEALWKASEEMTGLPR